MLDVFFFCGRGWRRCRSGFAALLIAIAIFITPYSLDSWLSLVLIYIYTAVYISYNNPARLRLLLTLFHHISTSDLSLFFFFLSLFLSSIGNPPSPLHLLLFFCKQCEFFCSGSLFMHASRALSLSSSSWYAQHTHTHTSHPQDSWRRCIASLFPFSLADRIWLALCHFFVNLFFSISD